MTDLSVQRLKSDKQTRYFDQSLPNFGVLVGKRTKTFFILKGRDRKLVTLGRYPEMSLKDARSAARLEMTKVSALGHLDVEDAIRHYLDDVKGRIDKQTHDQYTHYLIGLELTGALGDITRVSIRQKLAKLADRPTAQNMAHATLRGFFNWCLRQEYTSRV